jgi:acyl carrier protein
MDTSIETKIVELIRETTGNDSLEVNVSSRLIEDLGFDSVDFASLVMSVEEEYNGTVEEQEMSNIVTVADVIELISSKLQTA